MKKLTLFLFLWLVSIWSVHGQSASITIKKSRIKVGKVLNEISKQSGLDFSFNSEIIDLDKRIAFSVKRASLEETLQLFCEKIGLEYRLIEDQIVLNQAQIPIIEEPQYLTLSGFVNDETSGESLIGATIVIGQTAQGVITNEFGYYSMQLKPGNYQLQYSYVGYEAKTVDLAITKDLKKEVNMKPISISLPDVIVKLPITNLLNRDLDQLNFSPKALGKLPEFGGESGLVKGLQTLPGITAHGDGSSFFNARGGDRDQNLIIIDDAPIYNPMHFFGFSSIVIPDFVKSIDVYKSDIPTNLGDRLSSIVNIRTRDGNLNKFEVRGALNLFVNRFSLEIPGLKKKGSVFTSFRRSNFDRFTRQSNPDQEFVFGDFSFKWNQKLNDNNRMYFTTIWSADKYDVGNGSSIGWGNLAATLRWNHIFGPKLFSNTTFYTGNYGYRLTTNSNYWQSAIGTFSLKTDFTHYNSPKLTSRFGLEVQRYYIDPGSFAIDSTFNILPDIKPNYTSKSVLYYQGEYQISSQFKLKGGLRMINWTNRGPGTYYTFDDQFEVSDTVNVGDELYNQYVNLDPRLSFHYQLDNTSKLKLSLGVYHQYLQLVSNSTSPFSSFEVWLPAGPNIKPQSAVQIALNYIKNFEAEGLEFSTAVYYKNSENQIDYKPHPVTLLNALLEGELRFGTMQSYGAELMLKKETGRLNGWVSYTYSRAMRQTEGLNGGLKYPAFQDRPHDFTLNLNYQISPRIGFSSYYTIYSGSTFSSPTGFYDFNGSRVPIFDKKNNDRLPTYRRLDIAFQFKLNKNPNKRYQNSLIFSIYNFLANKNVILVNFNKVENEDGNPIIPIDLFPERILSATQIDLIRFFPSLTYKFKF